MSTRRRALITAIAATPVVGLAVLVATATMLDRAMDADAQRRQTAHDEERMAQ